MAAAALVAVVLVLKFGLGWLLNGRFMVETDDAYVEADTSVIAPEIAGTVAEVRVAENAPVRAGDVLVRLADEDYKAKVAQAESAVASQKAALANVDARLKWQRAMTRAAEASLTAARSDVERMTSDHERYARLVSGQHASAQKYEQARSDVEKARAAHVKAAAALEAEKEQDQILATLRQQIQAQISQAEAQAELARIDLVRTLVKAPVDGVAGNRGVQVGQYVRPGTQLLSIVPIPLVRVVANYKETQIAGLKRGQPVTITADAFPDVSISGKVESFAPASGSRFSLLPPENATGNFTKIVQRIPVRIAIDPDNALSGRLRPGLSVYVQIDRRHPGVGAHADLLVAPKGPPAALAAPTQGGAAKRADGAGAGSAQ
jgi:membrane fusion protein (multidrug efflux system)